MDSKLIFREDNESTSILYKFPLIDYQKDEVFQWTFNSNSVDPQKETKIRMKALNFGSYLMRFLEVIRGASMAAPIKLLPVM